MKYDDIYTEEVVEEEARQRQQWYEENERRIQVILAFADIVMETKDEAGMDKLFFLLKNEERTKGFSYCPELLFLYLAVMIYLEEQENDIYPTVFHVCSSVDDMIGKLRQVKFYFWEHLYGLGEPEEIKIFAKEIGLSICVLYQMMQCASLKSEKKENLLYLKTLFHEQKQWIEYLEKKEEEDYES